MDNSIKREKSSLSRSVIIGKKKYKKSDIVYGLLFIAPLVIGLMTFYIIPMFRSLFYAFTEWGMFGGWTWTGLDNFKKLIEDPQLFGAIKNTLKYAVLVVPLTIIIAILIATLLNSKIKGVGIYRVLYFLPAVTMTSAVAMIWRWMFNMEYGIINQGLDRIGITGPNWLTDPKVAIFSLVIIGVWSSLGTSMIIFLAGLQGIPTMYYEAAEIDGAGTLGKFFKITIPLLSPTIFFSLVTSLISALQVYDLIYMMFSQSNPALPSVQSLSYLFYKHGFILNDKGYASAIAIVLLCLTLVVTIVNFTLQKKWVHYE